MTVFGGRTRKIGTLLGRGLTFPQALEELDGVTLESVAITKVVINALEAQGADMSEFPLLMHIYELVNSKTTVKVPWQLFRQREV